jgi:hypothetical protein
MAALERRIARRAVAGGFCGVKIDTRKYTTRMGELHIVCTIFSPQYDSSVLDIRTQDHATFIAYPYQETENTWNNIKCELMRILRALEIHDRPEWILQGWSMVYMELEREYNRHTVPV